MRALVLAGATGAALAAPPPASQAALVRLDLRFGCLGRGWTRVDIRGACAGDCLGVACPSCTLTGSGEAYTSDGSCLATGTIYGDLEVAGQSAPFILTWTGSTWTVSFSDGTPGHGVVALATANCQGEGFASFAGVLGV